MIEEKVENLINMLDVKDKLAKELLAKSGGDEKKAIELFNSASIKELLILRGKYYGKRNNISGFFKIYINQKEISLEEIEIFSTVEKNVFGVDIDVNIELFNRIFKHYQEEFNIEEESEKALIKEHFKQYFHPGNILEVISLLAKKDWDKIRNIINNEMGIAINELAQVEIIIEEKFDIVVDIEDDDNYLEGVLEVDALNGIEVKKLSSGDKVFFKLIDNSEYGRFIAKTIGAKRDGRFVPVKGEILNISRQGSGAISSEYKIIVKVIEDISAKLYTAGEVKARAEKKSFSSDFISNQLEEYEQVQTETQVQERNSASKILTALVFAIIVFFVAFIAVILLGT